MARVQVYLTDDLHRQLKERGLSPSELLQRAIVDEVRRRELDEATDAYLADLVADVGEPGTDDVEYARRFVAHLTDPRRRDTA